MDEKKICNCQPFNKKEAALGASIVFLLCIGLAWGYIAKEGNVMKSCIFNYYQLDKSAANKKTDTNAEIKTIGSDAGMTYKTFSEASVYFTFEYPDNWSYKKVTEKVDANNSETFWNFYSGSDQSVIALQLHYPMYETAYDSCLKFPETTAYQISNIATNSPGTFVQFMQCNADLANSGSEIFLKKGELDPKEDKTIISKDGTEARMIWETDATTAVDHIAHSIKIK